MHDEELRQGGLLTAYQCFDWVKFLVIDAIASRRDPSRATFDAFMEFSADSKEARSFHGLRPSCYMEVERHDLCFTLTVEAQYDSSL